MGKRLALNEQQARGARRQQIGRLGRHRVERQVETRYLHHAWWLVQWMLATGQSNIQSWLEMDMTLEEYIEMCWDKNLALSVATNTLSAVQYFLKTKNCLKNSWKLISVWRMKEPPSRSPPLSFMMIRALAALAVLEKDVGMAASLLAGFDAMLRTGEITDLVAGNVAFTNDGRAILSLGFTKGGKRRGTPEFGVIDSHSTTLLLRTWLLNKPAGFHICGCSPAAWRVKFDQLLQRLNLNTRGYRPYSLRRGGATAFFLQTGRMDLVLERGRWNSTATAKLYINEGASLACGETLSPALQGDLNGLASLWGSSL